MKKLLILAILAVLAVILVACGSSNDETAKKDPNAPFSTGPSAPPAISTPTTPQPK